LINFYSRDEYIWDIVWIWLLQRWVHLRHRVDMTTPKMSTSETSCGYDYSNIHGLLILQLSSISTLI
jgi:hypothetical protein